MINAKVKMFGIRLWGPVGLLVILLTLFSRAGAYWEQQVGLAAPSLRITAVDVSRLPRIQLRVLGKNADGSPIDFAAQPVVVHHGSEQINTVAIEGTEDVGSLTVFLVDTPAGVEAQLPAIQAALSEYAGADFMREQVDFVAIYDVGVLTAQQILEPTPFYNTITNFLVDPLPVVNGPTALVDSIGGLLNSIEVLKPDPALAASIVVVSDGTDVVSSQFSELEILERAAELGIPLHTILVDNAALATLDEGGRFMNQLAAASGGIATRLSDGNTGDIWRRVSQFRSQTLLGYELTAPEAGEAVPIALSLADNPAVQAGVSIAISPAAGLLTLAVPADSRTLTVPNLDSPIRLRLPGTVAWVDGEERTLSALQLWSNGVPIADIDPGDLAEIDGSFNNFRLGGNQVWLTAVDSTGREMASPILTLTAVQGENLVVPELLAPPGLPWMTWLLACLAGAVLAAVLGGWYFLRGSGGFRLPFLDDLVPRRRPRRRRRPQRQITDYEPDLEFDPRPPPPSEPAGFAFDVIEAVTPVVSPIGLNAYEMHIGRAPSQVDIPFEQDSTVSRLHATIIREGHTYRIFDEESTSGTLVNGQRVPEYGTLLIDGDELQMGAVRLRFRVLWDWTP